MQEQVVKSAKKGAYKHVENIVQHASTEGKNEALVEAVLNQNPRTARVLLEYGADASVNCLTIACREGDLESVKNLLDFHATPNFEAIDIAIANSHTEILCALIDRVHSFDVVSMNQGFPLICAAKHGNLEITRLLLSRGASATDGGKDPCLGSKALIMAVGYQHYAVAEELLEAGADVHTEFEIPIKLAATNGDLDLVRLLLDYRANPFEKFNVRVQHPMFEFDYRNKYGEYFSAFSIAKDSANTSMMTLMLDRRVDTTDEKKVLFALTDSDACVEVFKHYFS